VPDIDQDDLPLFDGLDRVNQRSLLTYGFASRLLARTASAPADSAAHALRAPVYEVARLSIAQSYDFERVIDPVAGRGNADHFSDIDFALRVNPSRSTVVRIRSSYDTSAADISTATVGIRLQEPHRATEADESRPRLTTRNSFSVAYRFITANLLQQLESSTVVRLTDRIGALYSTRYDITENRFLENHFGFRYISACDCWSIDIGVTDKSNPNETEVRAQLTLVGLGSTGGFGLGN
jgi:LPS-assembly protein